MKIGLSWEKKINFDVVLIGLKIPGSLKSTNAVSIEVVSHDIGP